MDSTAPEWVDLTPRVDGLELAEGLRKLVESLPHADPLGDIGEHEARADKALRRYLRLVERMSPAVDKKTALVGVARVLSDLTKIGWVVDISGVSETEVTIRGSRPHVSEERHTRRRQLLAARGDALRDESTRRFVKNLEADKRLADKTVSIFSLMLDGRDLADRLSKVENPESLIQPYIQVISEDHTCEHTGLRLADVWRYFRLTWTNAPRSVPARQMRFLVRDAAFPNHPVIGIGELSGAAIKVGARDRFIGWDETTVEDWWRDEEPEAFVAWLHRTVEDARHEVFDEDFLESGVITGDWDVDASVEVISALRDLKVTARREHEESGAERSQADPQKMTSEQWAEAARLPLFVSKRASRLADLLEMWGDLNTVRDSPTSESLEAYLATATGKRAVARVVRTAKSRLQGTAIADLTVCGAIAPYNLLLGGKLVAMLAASPQIVAAYRERYSGRPSIIASSTAGRPIRRDAELVLISTTGLYGVRPSQYDRLAMPASVCGGDPSQRIRWNYLKPPRTSADLEGSSPDDGKTAGWGTFQFGSGTVRALESWLVTSTGRRRVTYKYGEGASPRLRLLREGLGSLGLDPAKLLVHGLSKTLYVCPLIDRPYRYLLGLERRPPYILPAGPNAADCTTRIAEWWRLRWLAPRIERDEIAEQIRRHTLIRPVEHGARVELPDVEEEQIAFFDAW